MVGIFGINETLNTLKAIFEKHKEERVCVLGTICAGKSTLLSQLPGNCEDLDDVLWPNLPEEETAFLRQSKWTEEMGNEIDRLVYKYVKIKPAVLCLRQLSLTVKPWCIWIYPTNCSPPIVKNGALILPRQSK
jgi:ATPase subunit of ABC transporter with duplicated ATPase domains